jgi:hypothetical protein
LLNGILDAADSAGALQALFALIDEVSFAIDAVAWGEQALPVLAGAPLAVVRARLMLELQGPPAARQDWNETGRDNTGGFEECELSIALGSPELLDDGLIGFYTDDDYTSINSPYRLRTPHDYVGARPPRLRPVGSARLLTLLMAPQAKAHALPGLLPAETIILPPRFTIAPLAALEMLFRIGPLLGDTTGVTMPLPSVNQGIWSWLQYLRTDEFALPMPITQSVVLATLPDAPGMAREGWLSLKPAGAPSVLSYALNPPNVPVTRDETNPSTVVLTITAYNGTGADQPVSRIGLAVPLGTDGAAVTAFPEYIVPALPGMPGFIVQAEAPGRFAIQPIRAGVTLRAGETLKLTLAGMQINRTAGSALLRLEETVEELLTTTLLLMKTGV